MMQNIINPKISIIVPYYNAKNYLAQLFNSLLNQTYSNFEILIIDDFSNDGGVEIIKEYQEKDSRIKLYFMPKKGGCGCAGVEEGLKYITGDYFLILTQDDYIDKDYLEVCVDKINNTGAEIVLTNAYLKRKKGLKYFCKKNHQKYLKYKNFPDNKELFWQSINWKIANTGVRSVKLLEKEPFVFKYYNADEFLFRKYLLLTKKIIFANTFFYYTMDNPNALTKQRTHLFYDVITTDIILAKCLIEYKFSKNVIDKRFKKLLKQQKEWTFLYKKDKNYYSEDQQKRIENIISNAKRELIKIVTEQNLFWSKLYLKFHKFEDI